MSDINLMIDRAIIAVNDLSVKAKAEGDLPTMYAANRAWRQLYDAREDRRKRASKLSRADREVGS